MLLTVWMQACVDAQTHHELQIFHTLQFSSWSAGDSRRWSSEENLAARSILQRAACRRDVHCERRSAIQSSHTRDRSRTLKQADRIVTVILAVFTTADTET